MFLHEISQTSLWFALIGALVNLMFLLRLSNGPTLSVHRYLLKSQISQYFGLWLFGALYFYVVISLDIFTQSLANLLLLLFATYLKSLEDRRKKQFFEEELRKVKDHSTEHPGAPSQPPIEETNLSIGAVWRTLIFSFALTFLCIAVVSYRFSLFLYHPEEYWIGGTLVAIALLFQLYFSFCCLLRVAKNDFPEITPKNRDDIYWRIIECRDGKKAGCLTFLLGLAGVAVCVYSVFAFMNTPFTREVLNRVSAGNSRYFPIESRIIAVTVPESQLKIAAMESRDNFWTMLFKPLGFAGDDEGCSLYSDLVREVMILQTQNATVKPQVEPMILAPDFLAIPFYHKLEKQGDAAHYLEQIVFGNVLDEPAFEAARTSLLEKLQAEKSNAVTVASKFALVARRQVCDFGNENIVLLDELEKAAWPEFREYYRNRFSRHQVPLVFESGKRSVGATLDVMERQLKPLEIDARRKPPPLGAAPGEYRAVWDLEFPAMIATWPLGDAKDFPDEHGNTLLAIKGLEQQFKVVSNNDPKIAAVVSGSFAAPEGLVVFLTVVWEQGTAMNEALAFFESKIDSLTETNLIPDWLQADRLEIAQTFAPRWLPGMQSWSASSTMHFWGINQYRYASILDSEEQYQTLAKSVSHANSWSVKRAFEKCLTKDQRTLVVFTASGK